MSVHELKILVRAVDQATSIFGKIGQKINDLTKRFGGLGQVAQIAGGFIVGQLAMRALDAVTDFVKGSIDAFAKFEDTLTTIVAVSGKTGAEAKRLYQELERAAHTAGVQFAVGANKAAQALESLVKAGLEGENAIKALNAALALAQIEGIETAQASDMLVGVMNQFHYSASEATKVVDTLVNASMVGIDTASGFATALSYCGATAAAVGFTLQETAAALVAINNQGIAAEKAGRYLNAMFEALIKNSDKLGFSIYDSSGRMLSLKQIVAKLTVKLESFGSQAERDAYLSKIFGRQAARAALSLLNLSDGTKTAADVLAELESQMDKSGSAMDIAGQKLNTLKGAQMKLAAATERLQVLLGKALAPVVSAVADFLSQYFIPALEWVGGLFVELWNKIKPVAEFLYWLARYVIEKYVIPAFQWLADVLKPVIDALGTVTNWIGQAWDWICNAVGQATEGIKNALGIAEEAHEELAETVEEATEEVAESYEDNFGVAELKAEEFALTVEKLAEQLKQDFNLMRAKAAENLSKIAKQFDEAFKAGRFKEAAEIIADFANQYQISFDQAENILREFIDEQAKLLKESRKIHQEHIEWLKTQYFERYVQNSDKFVESVKEYGEKYKIALENSLFAAEFIIGYFANVWGLTWEQAAEILQDYVDNQEKLLKQQEETLQSHIERVKSFFFDTYIKETSEFVSSVNEYAEEIRQIYEVFGASSEQTFTQVEALIANFAEQWDISWEDAADILFEAVEKMKEKAAEVEEIPKTFEEQLLERAQKDFEKFKECVSGKALTLQTDVTGEMSNLANNITELIKAGLVGEAQNEMQAYVECSSGKIFDMVKQIDQYMAELTEEHNEKIEEMKAYAETLTGAEREAVLKLIEQMTAEYEAKMEQLAKWKEELLGKLVETTQEKTEEIKQNLIDPIESLPEIYSQKLGETKQIVDDFASSITDTFKRIKIGVGVGAGSAAIPFEPIITRKTTPGVISINAPLVNVEGSADKATAELAAKLVEQKLKTVIIEASSSAAPTKRIRITGMVM